MNKKQIFLILGVVLMAVLMIGGIWGSMFLDLPDDTVHAAPSETTAQETQSSDSALSDTDASSQTTTAAQTVYPEVTLPVANKRIAITFDDGPSNAYTKEILDVLDKYHAKATFFTVGYQLLDTKGDLLRRMVYDGHEIGNHSATHPSSLTELSEKELLEEIKYVNDRIYELTNGYVCTLLRPPGGHINGETLDLLYADGIRMHTILWDSDTRDWEFNANAKNGAITTEDAIEGAKALALSQVSDGSILLMHDIKEITPALLESILETLTNDGYEFVTVSELFDFEAMGENAYFSKFYAENDVMLLQ